MLRINVCNQYLTLNCLKMFYVRWENSLLPFPNFKILQDINPFFYNTNYNTDFSRRSQEEDTEMHYTDFFPSFTKN